jgi:hypothetical protein
MLDLKNTTKRSSMSSSIVREPLNFGGFLKLLITFYKQFFLRGICYGLFVTAPSFIYTVIVGPISKGDATRGQIICYVIMASVSVLIANFGYIAISKACSQYYLGEPVDWKMANAVAKKNLWRFMGVSMIIGILFGLGLICLVIPGILVLMTYAVALPVVALENRTVLASLNRSEKLTSGNRWRIFGYLSVFGIFTILFGMLVAFVVAFFSGPENFAITYTYGSYVGQVCCFALMPLYTTLLYFDLCVRKQAATPQNMQVIEDEATTVLE